MGGGLNGIRGILGDLETQRSVLVLQDWKTLHFFAQEL